jgi:hypothetical protein
VHIKEEVIREDFSMQVGAAGAKKHRATYNAACMHACILNRGSKGGFIHASRAAGSILAAWINS